VPLERPSLAGLRMPLLDKMEKELTKLGCGGVSVVTKVAASKRKIFTVTGLYSKSACRAAAPTVVASAIGCWGRAYGRP